jgi:hypothetical protein
MNDTQATLKVINQMQAAGVIGKYAIGGAVAAAYYPIEATSTFDIDIFIPFENIPGSSLVSLDPIFSYLIPLGYKPEGAHIIIENWQVQFLPAADELYSEALLQAVEVKVGEVKTWIMKAEHLMAIALRLGRGKDKIRLEQFVQHGASYDSNELNQILARHKLVEKWQQFNDKYIGGKK